MMGINRIAVITLIASASFVDAIDVLSKLRDIPSSSGLKAPLKPTTFPSHILNRLSGREKQWDKLSPAIQRAVLWDGGLVAISSDSTKYVQVYVPCGHTMNDVFIDLERMQAFDQADFCKLHSSCVQNTMNFVTTQCFIDTLIPFTRCGIDAQYLNDLSTEQGAPYPAWSQCGTISKSFDPQVFRRIGGTQQSNGSDFVSTYTIVEDSTVQILRTSENDGCPARSSFVTPCRALGKTELSPDSKQWCVPEAQLGLILWLDHEMPLVPEESSSAIQIVLIVLLAFATLGCVVLLFILYRKDKKPSYGEYPMPPHMNKNPYVSVSHASTNRTNPNMDIETTNEAYRQQSKQLSDFCTDPSLSLKRIRYQSLYFHQCISNGNQGQVWRGEYQGQDVAIKQTLTLQGQESLQLHTLESFTCEIRLASSLDHPNIVTFIGFSWRLLPELCMISEYMMLGDLWQFLQSKDGQELTWKDDKVAIACDIANALVYLHSLAPMVIHRDLKSSNVLLNEQLTAKLSDFGLSREQAFDATMTRGVGTTLWTAPEVLCGERYNEKVDIYSFGIILSEIDTHLTPYALNPEFQLYHSKTKLFTNKISKGEIQPNVRKDCPGTIRELMLQCLSRDPKERPSAMQVVYTFHSKIRPHL